MYNNNHPLIERSQNFILDRKILFIDSNDRDVSKWPNSNEFEVDCPQPYTNVESIRILNIQVPNYFYNISEKLQNNKFFIDFNNNEHSIQIDDGNYTAENLEITLNNLFKNIDSKFVVKFNSVNKKFYFAHEDTSFSLKFNKQPDFSNCINTVFDQHSNWGIGYSLGFQKQLYQSTTTFNVNDISFMSSNSGPWITGSNINLIKSPKIIDLENHEFVFVELDKFNKCDELKPHVTYYNSRNNAGIVNSAFAKIPIVLSQYNQCLMNDAYLENISYYQPPIERIQKLKFKFRYHNGMLVDFQNFNISFALEINQIRNELKDYKVRTPYKY